MSLFRSLQHRPFALLWTGQTLSRIGDRLYYIALIWFLTETTGSAAAIGKLFIFGLVPRLLFLLIGGVTVDRFPRLRIMLLSDLARGLLVGCVAVLALMHRLEVWHLYLTATVFGFVDAFFQPAYTAVVPELVPADVLPSANSLTSLSAQFIGVGGPAAAALLVQLGGAAPAFVVDALSFVVSAACLLPLVAQRQPHKVDPSVPGMFADLRAGLVVVGASPWLWITIALASLANITLHGPLSVALPLLVEQTLHADVGTFGLISSMTSVGGVVAAVGMGRVTKLRHRGVLTYGAWAFGQVMVVGYSLPIGIPGMLIAAALLGATMMVGELVWVNTLQQLVPQALLGRVSSVDQVGSFALLPVGFALAGWATDLVGPPLVFVIGGAISLSCTLLGLLHPAIRHLD